MVLLSRVFSLLTRNSQHSAIESMQRAVRHAIEKLDGCLAATSEHAEGHNEATAAADRHAEGRDEAAAAGKGRNEATAVAAKKNMEDVLRSQNNNNCTSEEDDEIMAHIDERRKIKKEDKELLEEVSKKIKKCIRDVKRFRRQAKIQNIKSARK